MGRLSALSLLKPARPADLSSSKCTIQRSNSPYHLVSRSPRVHSSKPTDQTHISCNLLVGYSEIHENKTSCFWVVLKVKKKKKKFLLLGGFKNKKKKKKKKSTLVDTTA